METHRITQELNNIKDINDLNKLTERLNKNKTSIIKILNNISMIKDGSIIKVAFSMSKTQPKYLKEYIDLLEKEPNNKKYLDELYIEFKDNLDYTNTAENINKDYTNLSKDIENKKNSLNNIDNEKTNNNESIKENEHKLLKFKDKLLKFQISISALSNKVNLIKPEEKIETKYFLGNVEIKNNKELKKLAIKLSGNPQDLIKIEETYNKLRSNLKVITKKNIVPSNNYKMDLLNEKNNLNMTKNDLIDAIIEIKEFKSEFENEYNDILSTQEFYEYYEQIESLENKFTIQKDKADILETSIDKSILINDQKINEINELNQKKQEEEKKKEENNKTNEQNNNKETNKKTSQNQSTNKEFIDMYYNNYYNNMNYDYEEEKTRGHHR